MNDKFVYDETSSILYAPDGRPLKKVHCPKAMHWNQLVVDDGQDRWRGCTHCQERVVNLDVVDVDTAVDQISKHGHRMCIHGSTASGKVIFLKQREAALPASESKVDENGRIVIATCRSISDINRYVGLGYWPDVRHVRYDSKNLSSKISIGQHIETGLIQTSGDYRLRFWQEGDRSLEDIRREIDEETGDGYKQDLEREYESAKWVEALPFINYYPYYQSQPVAAYMIPKKLQDGAALLIKDPIEDGVGAKWNQGSAYRRRDVTGILTNRQVVLDAVEKPVPGAAQKPRRFNRIMG